MSVVFGQHDTDGTVQVAQVVEDVCHPANIRLRVISPDLWVLVFDDFEQCKVELLHNDPHDTDAILVRDSSIALDDVGVIYAGQKVNFTLEIIDDDFASEPCPNNFKAVGSPYLLSWTLTAVAGSSHGSSFLVSAAAACGAL